jgi:cytochrome c oxidase subunit 2
LTRGAEAILALVLTAVLGGAFWLFAGDTGSTTPDDTQPTGSTAPLDSDAAARGQVLANEVGCAACHTSDGTDGTGPTWQGLAGSTVTLDTGETVVADTDYLTRSITEPAAQLVDGFDPVMPATYADQLTTEEISDLVAYIQSLA